MRSRGGYVLIFIILLLLIIGLTPWVDGHLLKKCLLQDLAILQKNSAAKITIENYQVGWLHSTITYSLVLDENQQIKGVDEVTHGPIIYDPNTGIHLAKGLITTNIYLPADLQKKIFPSNPTQSIMQIATIATFGREYQMTFRTPIFSLNEPLMQFTWQGISGVSMIRLNKNFIEKITHDLKLGALRMKSKTDVIDSAGITSKGEYICQSENTLCASQGTTNLIDLNAQEEHGQNIKLNNLTLSYRYGGDNNNRYHILIDSSLANLNISGYLITDTTFKFEEKNLVRDKLTDLVFAIQKETLKWQNDSFDKQAAGLAILSTMGMLPYVIAPDTQFILNFSTKTSDGNVNLAALWTWPHPQGPTNILDLYQDMYLQVNLRINAGVINHLIILADQNAPKPAAVTANATTVAPSANSTTTLATQNSTDNTTIPASTNSQIQEANQTTTEATVTTPPTVNQEATPTTAKEAFNQMINRGILVQDNTDYVLSFQYKDKMIIINGKSMTPEEFAILLK